MEPFGANERAWTQEEREKVPNQICFKFIIAAIIANH